MKETQPALKAFSPIRFKVGELVSRLG